MNKNATGKKMVTYDWLVAAMIGREGCAEYNTLEIYEEDSSAIILPSKQKNIEEELTIKQLEEQLSDEAKKMIDLVLNSDDDFLAKNFTTSKYKCLSKQLIKEYYKKLGYKNRLIDSIFQELKEFVMEAWG